MRIPFTKAHGCGNDFLLVEGRPGEFAPPEALARAICDRRRGVGADGLYFVATPAKGADAEIHLYNSDGSAAELSGNGTRCVAAWLAAGGLESKTVRIRTGAGVRELRLLERDGHRFRFEMGLGSPEFSAGPEDSLAVWLGNPHCVVFVADFDFDWQRRGAALESHPHFPNRANVEFARVADNHALEIRIWERGAGHTLASGTGASAAAVAAIHSGRAQSPVTVRTEGGQLEVRWDKGEISLAGPAQVVAEGEFLWTP